MNKRTLSVCTIVYHTDLTLVEQHIRSIVCASALLDTALPIVHYIIDNSEDDLYFGALKTLIASLGPTTNYCIEPIKTPQNIGYGGANNLVIPQLDSSFHLIVNPDVLLSSEALAESIAFLQDHTHVGVLTPRVYGNSVCSHVVKRYPDCFTLFLRYLGRSKIADLFTRRLSTYSCDDLGDTAKCDVELAGGCYLFLRTELFTDLKGFCQHYFMYFEDFDLCMRARRKSRLAYVPAVKINHSGGDVGRKHYKHHLYFMISAVRFFNRWGWRLW